MATQKLVNRNIRKLMRTGRAGSSIGLTLPKELAVSLGWRERQKVVVKKMNGGLMIRDYKNKK